MCSTFLDNPRMASRALAVSLLCGCSFSTGGVPREDASAISDRPDGSADSDGQDTETPCSDAAGPCCGATEGARVCVDSASTGSCVEGNVEADRACPMGSACDARPDSGFDFVCETKGDVCQPCYSADCAPGTICSTFVAEISLQYCCIPDSGAGGAYSACASHSECASGLCITDMGICFFGCQSGCPKGGDCESRAVTIDGVASSVRTCVPL